VSPLHLYKAIDGLWVSTARNAVCLRWRCDRIFLNVNQAPTSIASAEIDSTGSLLIVVSAGCHAHYCLKPHLAPARAFSAIPPFFHFFRVTVTNTVGSRWALDRILCHRFSTLSLRSTFDGSWQYLKLCLSRLFSIFSWMLTKSSPFWAYLKKFVNLDLNPSPRQQGLLPAEHPPEEHTCDGFFSSSAQTATSHNILIFIFLHVHYVYLVKWLLKFNVLN
jgi:hypothetical protein